MMNEKWKTMSKKEITDKKKKRLHVKNKVTLKYRAACKSETRIIQRIMHEI